MALTSFIGRLLFASIFIFSAYQQFIEFGNDGGPAAIAYKPKLSVFTDIVASKVGIQLPEINIKDIVVATIVLKGVGGLLFILGSYTGAFLLILHQIIVTPILYDFYNYDVEEKEFGHLFIKFTQNMALLGALLFFIGMKNSISMRRQRRVPKSKTVYC